MKNRFSLCLLYWMASVVPMLLSACALQPVAPANPDLHPPQPLPAASAEPAEEDDTSCDGAEDVVDIEVEPQAPVDARGVTQSALAPQDIWARLRKSFQFPEATTHPQVQKQLAWYLRHLDYLPRVITRAKPFLHFILEEIERRDLPSELALLPVIESAYNPLAYSRVRAAGLWQFIPVTGRMYGLKQNWWYDGRRDVYASTHAALDYLSHINARFEGDWLLSLAAYNAGPVRVMSAMNRNRAHGRPADFWHLRLPRETRAYVPKLLAVKAIIEDPQAFGIELPSIPDEQRLMVVETQSQIDLALAAQLADMELDALYHLNPGFNRWATDPAGPHRLLLPYDQAPIFQEKLSTIAPAQRVTWIRHKIRRGDTLNRIARKYDTTVAVLKRTNKLRSNTIRAGKHLIVPRASTALRDYSIGPPERIRALGTGRLKQYHTVRRGESLWTIARRYQVSVKQLARWNRIAPKDILQAGERLVLWLNKPVQLTRVAPSGQATS